MNYRRRTKKRFIRTAPIIVLVLFLIFFLLGFATKQVVNLLSSPSDIMQLDEGSNINNTNHEIANTATTPEIITIRRTLAVKRGDVLLTMLQGQGIEDCDAYAAISALGKLYDPRDLRPGQEVTVIFEHPREEAANPEFCGVRVRVDTDRDILTKKNGNNEFITEEIKRKFIKTLSRTEGTIQSSLYESAIGAGVPLPVLMQLIGHFSFDVDFQRDIRPGNSFEVLYELHLEEDGTLIGEGPVLYASLTLRDERLFVYRHTTGDGITDYFDENGRTVRKTLLKTPIDGARLTSGYGIRRHPIKGYSAMHQGLDFAAPRGTPIMASGNGTLLLVGRKGNYGRCVRIRHANSYSTVYAHLSCFARDIKKGKRVKQGQIIGYVGSTGMATGPHLHYEVCHRGRQINPARVKFPPRRTLKNGDLEHFLITKAELDRAFTELGPKTIIVSEK